MFPYKDDNPVENFPLFTIIFIVLNVLIFFYSAITDLEGITYSFGAVPSALMGNAQISQSLPPAFTVTSSMFLHGGLLHLAGNMLYLWVFGNNIEDKLGPVRFVLFYLLCGYAGAYADALTVPNSDIPMIGASGAVSGILGAYILLFPRAQIYTLLFFGFFVRVVRLPALIVIGFWAIIQVVSGVIDKAVVGQGGVAWFAHIGGFVFGVLLIKIFLINKKESIAS